MRISWISVIALLMILLADARALAESETRTVQVSGAAEVHADPDRAVVALGVEARKSTLDAARMEVAHGIEALLKLTHELKIDIKDVRTTHLVVQPEYNWGNVSAGSTRERRLVGYYVARQAEIVVRDLDQLGVLLERAVSAGVNSVGEPHLESSRERDLEREALALAIEDAHQNADTAARAAKIKLGAVRTIDSTLSRPRAPIVASRFAAATASVADSDTARTYQVGQLTFSASVRMEYDIAD